MRVISIGLCCWLIAYFLIWISRPMATNNPKHQFTYEGRVDSILNTERQIVKIRIDSLKSLLNGINQKEVISTLDTNTRKDLIVRKVASSTITKAKFSEVFYGFKYAEQFQKISNNPVKINDTTFICTIKDTLEVKYTEIPIDMLMSMIKAYEGSE